MERKQPSCENRVEAAPDLRRFGWFTAAQSNQNPVQFSRIMKTRIASPTLVLTGSILAGAFVLEGATTPSDQQPPRVQIIASDQEAAERAEGGTPNSGEFMFCRSAGTTAALMVHYTISGTASNGADYETFPNSVVFPPGAAYVAVAVTPIADSEAEDSESVVVTLDSDAAYSIGSLSNATVWISGEKPGPLPDPWRVRVYATAEKTAEGGSDPGQFIITRSDDWYDTSRPLTVNFALGGTASNGMDYLALAGAVTIPAGASHAVVNLSPIDDRSTEGSETVTLTLAPSFDYFVRSPESATVTIEDNDPPPTPFPLTRETKLSSPGPLAISGDTALIGEHVFVRSSAGWIEQQTLPGGEDAAIDGDTLVSGTNIYARTGTNWSLQQTLPVAVSSVAISGDTIAVGQTSDGTVAEYAGAVHVFVRNGTHWVRQATLTASDRATYAGLGVAVTIDGDTVVAGAPGVGLSFGAQTPSAYVFVRNGTNWIQQAKLTGDPGKRFPESVFGVSVSVSGNTIVVGDPYDDAGGQDGGGAFVFAREGAGWALQQKMTGGEGDFFGYDVAIDGDVLVGGAPLDDERGRSAGSATLFKRSGTAWTQVQKLTASDAVASDNFGERVVIGAKTVICGATGTISRPPSGQGASYVYEAEAAPIVSSGGLVFAITSISTTLTNGIEITWTSTPGRTYRVAYKNSLADTNWSMLSPAITATAAATATSWTDTTTAANGRRFYLVQLLQ